MKLVGPWLSGYTRRTGITLKLLGVPFEHLAFHAYDDKEKVRRYSPMGKVPALVLDDGEILLDSGSIIDFLQGIVGTERALLPPAGTARRHALNLVGIGIAIYGKLSGVFEEYLRPQEHRVASFVAGYAEQAMIGFELLEQAAGDGWLVEDKLGQADIMTVVCYQMASLYILPDAVNERNFPKLAALAGRAMELEAFSSTLP